MSGGDLYKFLETIFSLYEPPFYIEVQGRYPKWDNQKPDLKFFTSIDSVCRYVSRNRSTNANLFFGVLPRDKRQGTKDSITNAAVLWVDIDFKHFEGINHDEIYSRFFRTDLGVPNPNIIVHSGGGFHGYWLLDKPTQDVIQIELICRGLHDRLEGDRTFNINRILRLPTTNNTKDRERIVQAEYELISTNRYKLEDFEALAALGKDLEAQGLPSVELPDYLGFSDDFNLNDVEEPWRSYIQHGIVADTEGRFNGDRSKLDFSTCIYLLSGGLSEDTIAGLFLNPQYGISQKTLEKSNQTNSLKYIWTTIKKARTVIEKEN